MQAAVGAERQESGKSTAVIAAQLEVGCRRSILQCTAVRSLSRVVQAGRCFLCPRTELTAR